MIDPTKPTLPERYAGAIESKHLEVLQTRCSVDYLIAAGWISDGLGVKLFRLRTEWDAVRGDHRLAVDNAQDSAREVFALRKLAATTGAKAQGEADANKAERMAGDAERTAKNAEATAEGAKAAALTARALMMVHLKTLPEARSAVHNFARALALRERFMPHGKNPALYRDQELRRTRAVAAIAARALELWIDSTCPHCNGRRFNGGHSTPITWCQPCGATGDRGHGPQAFRLAKDDAGHSFGRALMSAMDAKAEWVARRMGHFMAQRDAAIGLGVLQADAVRRLRDHLAQLRASEAQED